MQGPAGAGRKSKSPEDKQKIQTEMKVKFKPNCQKHRDEKLTRQGQRNLMNTKQTPSKPVR